MATIKILRNYLIQSALSWWTTSVLSECFNDNTNHAQQIHKPLIRGSNKINMKTSVTYIGKPLDLREACLAITLGGDVFIWDATTTLWN